MNRITVAQRLNAAKDDLADEQLEEIRLNVDGRQRIVDAMVGRMRGLYPAFGDRPMTYDDAVQVVQAAGLAVDIGARGYEHQDGYIALRNRVFTVVVHPGLLEPYLVHVIFYLLAHQLGEPAKPLVNTHEDALDPVTCQIFAERNLESHSLAYLALVGEPAGAPYPVIQRVDTPLGEEKTITLTARHAVRRRGQAVEWEHRSLTLNRYIAVPKDVEGVRWTDEDVLRVVRAAVFSRDVELGASRRYGPARVGAHYASLKAFSAALARFGGVVTRGADEIQRRGHRDLVKASAYTHAVKVGR
jgi:hypothetical protein